MTTFGLAMQTLTPQTLEFHTLREDLDLRANHRLVEADVNDLLKQALPQLDWLHRQDKSHGSISLDTLVFYEGQIRLIENDSQPQEFPNPSQDIAALGQVVLQALTAKPLENLRDAHGTWIWEDECLVTDHLANVVNQMIGNSGQPPLSSAQQVLAMLNHQSQAPSQTPPSYPPSPPQPTVSTPPETSTSYTQSPHPAPTSYGETLSPGKSQIQDWKKTKLRLKLWQWGALGTLCGIGLLSAIALPTFLSQASRAQLQAQNYLEAITEVQQSNFEGNNSFLNSWDELALGINSDEKFYKYNMYKLNDVQVVVTASAKARRLKSYSAIIFLTQSTDGKAVPNFMTCQTIEPSRIPPQPIQLLETSVVCPPGSETIVTSFEGGRNLFEPPSQASSSNTQDQSRRNHQNNTPSSRPLTQDEAVVIVNRWLSAKPRIFGPPFDRNLLGQLSTGSIYQSNLGSIDWLQNNGYYYAYTVSEIRNVWSFTTSDTNPSVTVNVYEDLTLHGPRGIDRSKSGASTRNFIYYFSRDVDGQWKISSYERSEPTSSISPSNSDSLSSPSYSHEQTSPPSIQDMPDERVNFVNGSTGSTVYGELLANQRKRYILWCGQGQLFSIRTEGDLNVIIKAPNGQLLGNLDKQNADWQGTLPLNGDYLVEVSALIDSRYMLRFEVN
jgi:ARC6-like, IMS domain/Type IV pilin-like G and H, putative